jgi:hypothetical protein
MMLRKSCMSSNRSLLFSLLITFTLLLPGMLGDITGITFFSTQPPEDPGLAPQTGQWVYISTSVQRYPLIDKWALLPVAMTLVVQSISVSSRYVSALGQAALPHTHRLQYMIPMYFSTCT